jgi:hypothetical protein
LGLFVGGVTIGTFSYSCGCYDGSGYFEWKSKKVDNDMITGWDPMICKKIESDGKITIIGRKDTDSNKKKQYHHIFGWQ